MINLNANERIDDLNIKGYQIIQNPDLFCFGMDAVLLSGFTKVKTGQRVLDMGTGTGVIPILLEAKTKGREFIGLEIQELSYDMACRSVALNGLEEKVHIVKGDIKQASEIFGKASFDVVTCNPPYMNDMHGLKNPDLPKAIARHEVLCTLEDVCRQAGELLRVGGSFHMVHKPFRLAEIFTRLQQHGLEPKRMRLVHPYIDKEPNMVLIEAVKGGKSMIKIGPPLIVYKEPKVYTDEIHEIYSVE